MVVAVLLALSFLGGCAAGEVDRSAAATSATTTSASSTAVATTAVSTTERTGAAPTSTAPLPTAPPPAVAPPTTVDRTTVVDGIPPVPDGPATALVDRLVMADPSAPEEYRRAAFGSGWDYDPTTGCNTRELVLAEESGPGLVVDDRCRPVAGSWTSIYDGMVTSDAADLEIDHVVPLAEAWRTGAATWTAERREAFANDLDDPGTLVAVSSRSNRSKQDSTPAGWLPDSVEGRCWFVEDWVRVKYRWGLTVAPDEKVAITQVLAGC
ncbi:MAG: HNH endonuclease [Actinobacteria bacterium]|nr:HNH endonuclease [Actinomycetota bacterium]